MPRRYGCQHCVTEWGYASSRAYDDPFAVELDVLFQKGEHQWQVPAYWAGGQEWRVRFAPPETGTYTYRTLCSDEANTDLHGIEGTLEVRPYEGDNPLLQHGPLTPSEDGRYLQHADGEPFFWLGDTWWMGLTRRLHWPNEFQRLTADRVDKGFSVIQIVAGLYPDMPAFDPRGFNEAGHPWEEDYARINPAYFDMADLRLQWLIKEGLVPCIVGCWGYHLLWLGLDRMKQHWRYLVARYGAYPVVWCLAGEGMMPYYLSEDKEADREALRQGWTDVGRHVRALDPFGRPITIHAGVVASGRDQLVDDEPLDLDMLQTGHGGYDSLGRTIESIRDAAHRDPHKVVVEGEVCYEGIMGSSYEDVQRLMFWAAMLSGAKAYTYGANGLWQLNREGEPYGPSPHGAAWGNLPWNLAYRLPGSTLVGIGRRILEQYPWWRFEPHPEWITPHAAEGDYLQPLAAGIPGGVRLIYLPRPITRWGKPVMVEALDADTTYRVTLHNPQTGGRRSFAEIEGQTRWQIPVLPVMHDWVVAIEPI